MIQPAALIRPLWQGYAASSTDDAHLSRTRLKGPTPVGATVTPNQPRDLGCARLLFNRDALQGNCTRPTTGRRSAPRFLSRMLRRRPRSAHGDGDAYPEDFDGVIAPSRCLPKITRLLPASSGMKLALEDKPESKITGGPASGHSPAALAACDGGGGGGGGGGWMELVGGGGGGGDGGVGE